MDSYEPLGNGINKCNECSSDVLLIAGTNCNLAEHVAQGKFREVLLARLNLWMLNMLGLKNWREDIDPRLPRFAAARRSGKNSVRNLVTGKIQQQ